MRGKQLPVVSDLSAFWRQWDAVPFLDAPDVTEDVIASELAGVLRWSLNGLAALLDQVDLARDRPRLSPF